jgi:hypothetical protein
MKEESEKNMCLPEKNLLHSKILTKSGLGPKSFGGNRFYEGHRDISEKASHHFKNASIPLKVYLKSPAILKPQCI